MRFYSFLVLLACLSANVWAQNGKCLSGNCKTGQGRMLYADSSTYEGGWAAGKPQGMGTFEGKETAFTGMWNGGVKADSGIFTAYHILHSENRVYAKDVRIGRVTNDKLNGPGVFISFTMSGGILDTQMVWKGNFANDQLSGKGTYYIPHLCFNASDSWTDNFHFDNGSSTDIGSGTVRTGRYENGIITPNGSSAAATTASTPPPAKASSSSTTTSSSSSSSGGGSMLDYGIFAIHKTTAQAGAKTHDYKVYCFFTSCSQGGKQFKVLSKVTADLAKHTLEEMKSEALHRISNNGWMAQSNPEYVGTADDLRVNGSGYTTSEVALYDY